MKIRHAGTASLLSGGGLHGSRELRMVLGCALDTTEILFMSLESRFGLSVEWLSARGQRQEYFDVIYLWMNSRECHIFVSPEANEGLPTVKNRPGEWSENIEAFEI